MRRVCLAIGFLVLAACAQAPQQLVTTPNGDPVHEVAHRPGP